MKSVIEEILANGKKKHLKKYKLMIAEEQRNQVNEAIKNLGRKYSGMKVKATLSDGSIIRYP